MEKPEWKSVNWFIVSFESSFDQLKIYFYTEIKKKRKRIRHLWKLSTTIEQVDRVGPVDRGVNF